jgi:hypothetical protein
MTPWYEFWNPASGFWGGCIMGLLIMAVIAIVFF